MPRSMRRRHPQRQDPRWFAVAYTRETYRTGVVRARGEGEAIRKADDKIGYKKAPSRLVVRKIRKGETPASLEDDWRGVAKLYSQEVGSGKFPGD